MIRSRTPGPGSLIVVFAAFVVCLVASLPQADQSKASASADRRAAGLAAWQQVYTVLTHQRCINCHTATHYPQQGDDWHPARIPSARKVG
jgi:mono/diheme cytochrome c family protein